MSFVYFTIDTRLGITTDLDLVRCSAVPSYLAAYFASFAFSYPSVHCKPMPPQLVACLEKILVDYGTVPSWGRQPPTELWPKYGIVHHLPFVPTCIFQAHERNPTSIPTRPFPSLSKHHHCWHNGILSCEDETRQFSGCRSTLGIVALAIYAIESMALHLHYNVLGRYNGFGDMPKAHLVDCCQTYQMNRW